MEISKKSSLITRNANSKPIKNYTRRSLYKNRLIVLEEQESVLRMPLENCMVRCMMLSVLNVLDVALLA